MSGHFLDDNVLILFRLVESVKSLKIANVAISYLIISMRYEADFRRF